MRTAINEYYSPEESIRLLLSHKAIIEDGEIMLYLAYALQFIPKLAVDWLVSHCLFGSMALQRLGQPDALGICEAIEANEHYWITLDNSLLAKSLLTIVETIMHECAHAVLRHNEKGKEHCDNEAENLVKRWINEWEYRDGISFKGTFIMAQLR